MPKPTYAEQLSNAQVMVAGLKGNAEQLSRRGIDTAFTAELETDIQSIITLNNEQEKIKSELKIKTAERDAKMIKLEKSISEVKKIAKIDFAKDQWKEFGIEDKR